MFGFFKYIRKDVILKLYEYIKTFIQICIRILKSIGKLYYSAKSSHLFIFAYLCLFIIMLRNTAINRIFFINFVLISIALILRTIKRTMDLKKMKYIQIYDFTKDREKRAENFNDLAILIFIMLFLILCNLQDINNNFYQYISLGLFLLCILFLLLYITIKKSSMWLGALSIIFTSFPGMLIFLAIFIVIISCLTKSIAYGNFTAGTQIIEDFPIAILILLTNGYKIYFLIFILISLSLQLIFVLIYPLYDLNILSFSFKVISLLMVIVSALIFINQSSINVLIGESKIELSKQLELDYIEDNIESEAEYNEIKHLINTIEGEKSASTLNMITLPFTLGSVLALYLIDLKRSKAQRKADKLFGIILEEMTSYSMKSVEFKYQDKILKECIYYGGSEFVRLARILDAAKTSLN